MNNQMFDVEKLDTRLEMQIISAAVTDAQAQAPCPQENGCQEPSCSIPF
ncbi:MULTISPECIES: hypothetical protein [unclassified Colwellia]|jgi:hypothetical protein|nr:MULTISPECIES: hypothetical protein [unclassified Colwellia]MBA6231892.1 hypothetical protein [Colwellia sp. MB02u-7]MBA6235935.1 hypothetical protein [Colwellia sp. MB02u-11]MBA6255229.1 hypothetical protein [Colwellia sp. MB3u-28]MBA6258606.1 hypothetical protein [Colwellia sp. MB3u-41]MBA6298649.1 hypothetical protein [Colwellia sp. MB3u-22]